MMASLVAQSSQMNAETPRRSRPPLTGARSRRSASSVQDHPALGLPFLGLVLVSPSCSFPMSRSIGKPLSDDTAQRAVSALHIVNAERNSLVVAEIELRQISLQVLLADVMIDA